MRAWIVPCARPGTEAAEAQKGYQIADGKEPGSATGVDMRPWSEECDGGPLASQEGEMWV